MFLPICKHREVGWKNEEQPRFCFFFFFFFFCQLRGVGKFAETFFRMFDVASQTINNY